MSDSLQEQMAQIAQAVANGLYRYTVHGAQQRIARQIQGDEIEGAIESGEIIEDYPRHHRGPACLILGHSSECRPIHIVCSVRSVVDIITVYEPDPAEWEADGRIRRS